MIVEASYYLLPLTVRLEALGSGLSLGQVACVREDHVLVGRLQRQQQQQGRVYKAALNHALDEAATGLVRKPPPLRTTVMASSSACALAAHIHGHKRQAGQRVTRQERSGGEEEEEGRGGGAHQPATAAAAALTHLLRVVGAVEVLVRERRLGAGHWTRRGQRER